MSATQAVQTTPEAAEAMPRRLRERDEVGVRGRQMDRPAMPDLPWHRESGLTA